MLPVLLLAGVSCVLGHGGMVWPPIWQDGHFLGLDQVFNAEIKGDPVLKDPKTGKQIKNTKTWLTDQAYTGGHGHHFQGVGPQTNLDYCKASWNCGKLRFPWAAPGQAPNLGGGCGIHGGNPAGCPAGNDSRPAGSRCGQTTNRGTWSFGSSALEIEFPEARVTEWARGTTVPVAFVTGGGHGGGYTYRLCKLPAEGRAGITEECFARNILEFSGDQTFYRDALRTNLGKEWQTEEKADLTIGTYPEGSAWRYVGPKLFPKGDRFFKDHVKVPADLEAGEYVLSWRWDTASAAQVWVSCASIAIV